MNQNEKEKAEDSKKDDTGNDKKVKENKHETINNVESNEIRKEQIKKKNKNKAFELLENFSQNEGKKFLSGYSMENGTHVYEFSVDFLLEGKNEPIRKKMFRVVLDDSKFTVNRFDLSGNKSEVLYYLNLDEKDGAELLNEMLFAKFLLLCDRIFCHCKKNNIKASIPKLRGNTLNEYDDYYKPGDFCIDFDFEAPNDIVDYLGERIYKIRMGNNGIVKLWTEELRNGSPKFELYRIFPRGYLDLKNLEKSFVTEKTQDIIKESSFAFDFAFGGDNVLLELPEDNEVEKCIKGLIQKKFSSVNGYFADAIFIDEIYRALSPDLNKIKEKMMENVKISLENAAENVYGNKAEEVIRKKNLMEKNINEARKILSNLAQEPK